MTRDKGDGDARQVAAWALLGFTVVVAVVTFVLSFHGLDGYGKDVAKVGRLSWLVPLGVDGLTLTAVAATFLLRNAAWRVRAYAWFVFVVANGASVAGNLSHGASQHLSRDGMVGAAAWPLLLALASHLAIVTRRAMDKAEGGSVDTPSAAPEVPQPQAVPDVAPDTQPVADPKPPATRKRIPTRPVVAKERDQADQARDMWRAGKSHSDIGTALSITKRTAERYTAELRQGATAPAVSDSPPQEPTDSDSRDSDTATELVAAR